MGSLVFVGILLTMVDKGGNVDASSGPSKSSCYKSLMVAKAALARDSLAEKLALEPLARAVVRPQRQLGQLPKARAVAKEQTLLGLVVDPPLEEALDAEDLGFVATQLDAQVSLATDP